MQYGISKWLFTNSVVYREPRHFSALTSSMVNYISHYNGAHSGQISTLVSFKYAIVVHKHSSLHSLAYPRPPLPQMPLCTVHLLALHHTTPNYLATFLSTLKSSNAAPLVISKVVRWIILPTHLSTAHLLARNISWDLYLILPSTSPLPAHLDPLIEHHWTITAGVPSRLTSHFSTKNRDLLHPVPSTIAPLTPSPKGSKTTTSSQNLELSAELETWIEGLTEKEKNGAVSMFNLLAFNNGMKSEYLKYGAAFAASIGARHGGNAKIVGNVVAAPVDSAMSSKEGSVVDASADGWDEIALAHYPSILHFREMLVSGDYQEVNHKHRVGSLRDTCILMTSEVAVEELVGGGGSKL